MSLSQMLAQASQQQSVSAQNPVGNLMQSSIMQSEAMSNEGQQAIAQNRLPFSPETMNQANKLHEVSNRLEHIGHINLARQLRDSIDQAATGNAPPAWQPRRATRPRGRRGSWSRPWRAGRRGIRGRYNRPCRYR